MQFLKANTAVDILIGPFVDDTDGKTAETALTLSQADIKLSKNGQTLAQKNDITTAVHDANGYYNCELDATDTNTEGNMVLIVHETGALPVRHEFNILSQAAYDSMFAAKDTGYMDINVKAISEDTTAADNAELAFDGTGYGFTGCTIPTVTTLTGHTAQTGDNYTRIGATGSGLTSLAQASVCTNTRLAELDAANIPADVDAILIDTGTTLDTKLNDIQGGTFSSATDSLEAIRDRGDAAWTTGAGGSDRLLMVDTTIATLSTQTSFTLTAGSADDNAYNNCTIVIEDASTSTQKAVGVISDYVGVSKTVTLKYDPAIFTMAATDKVYILAENALKTTLANRQLNVAADGDLVEVNTLTGHTVQTADHTAGIADIPTVAEFNARSLPSADYTIVSDLGTVQTGDTYAALPTNFSDLSITVTTGRVDVASIAGTAQTANDNGADINAILVDTSTTLDGKINTIDTNVDSILVDTSTTLETHLTDIKGTGFVKDTNSLIDLPVATNYTVARAGYLDSLNGHTAQTGDSFARLGAPAGASVSADIAAIPTSNESGFEKNVAVTAFAWTMVDDTDHVTLETGLQATLRAAGGAQISKDGLPFTDLINIASINHVANGIYEVDITQAEMNADSIVLKFVATGADTRIIYIKTSS